MTPEQLTRLPEILFQIGKVIGSNEPLAAVLTTISERVTELSGADACSVMLSDSARTRLLGKASYGLSRQDISDVSFRFGEGIAGWVAKHAQGVLLDDAPTDSRYQDHGEAGSVIHSLACVPLRSRDDVVGVLTITSAQVGVFSQHSMELLQLIANIIALDLENIRLRRVSVTDNLTGIYNRSYLERALPKCIEEAIEFREPLSLALIDVDHFKKVNDTYGHGVGDNVLTAVAKRLQSGSRGRDVLVRYGGEEFLLLLPSAPLSSAREIAERIRGQFSQNPMRVGSLQLDIKTSLGVTQLRPQDTGEALIKRADLALYRAKEQGRNRVEVAE